MVFNYSKLRGKIKEIFGTESEFSDKLGIAGTTLSAKLNNRVDLTQQEISKASKLLNIGPNELSTYLFTQKV